ncbi:L10-interacting MYB domain-containing protein-like [Lycium ferocissimum]|uniref:L10-interacting MYB domain-containing protein-like n=1 Tax=Lycium ferocissimum TaxID=112874 RepID=UPI002815757E|nr:L10-interacting MYB domain-containing protein-like [Lycium ferocissimum]
MSKKLMQDSNIEKAKWSTEHVELFLDLCVMEVMARNRPGTHFNKIGWSNMIQKFNDKTGKYDKAKLKNKWDSLKKTWKEWHTLIGRETGLGWDNEKKTIQASDEWWDKKIKFICTYPLSLRRYFQQAEHEVNTTHWIEFA